MTHGAGNDGEGPVTFTLQVSSGSGSHAVEVDRVRHFHFANGCSLNGSTVAPSMRLDSSGHFDYVARGFTVQGTFDNSDSQATGTARVERGGCDIGGWPRWSTCSSSARRDAGALGTAQATFERLGARPWLARARGEAVTRGRANAR